LTYLAGKIILQKKVIEKIEPQIEPQMVDGLISEGGCFSVLSNRITVILRG
jgi:hypothetical protein